MPVFLDVFLRPEVRELVLLPERLAPEELPVDLAILLLLLPELFFAEPAERFALLVEADFFLSAIISNWIDFFLF